MRFDGTSGNTRTYYLEDGMGSVIGIAPHSSPGTGNTSRLFYDGFGNSRATNGPAPTIVAGTGGDFRFHGLWQETNSGLYHVRAREYDARTGRFTSRDPEAGVFKAPESLHPYGFANANPLLYSDPSGRFSVVEVNLTSAMQFGGRSIQAGGSHAIKQRVRRQLGQAITKTLRNQVKDLIPSFDLPFPIPGDAGRDFETYARDAFRDFFCDELVDVPEWIYLQVPINGDGKALADGITCGRRATNKEELFYASFGVSRPDFVLGTQSPTKGGSWLIGDFKGRTGTIYREYLSPGSEDGKKQFQAILNYARKNTFSKTALFVVATDKNSTATKVIRKELIKQGISKGTMVLLVVLID